MTAEMELSGGVQPHMSPMTMMADVGGLLSGAGFTIPTGEARRLGALAWCSAD